MLLVEPKGLELLEALEGWPPSPDMKPELLLVPNPELLPNAEVLPNGDDALKKLFTGFYLSIGLLLKRRMLKQLKVGWIKKYVVLNMLFKQELT